MNFQNIFKYSKNLSVLYVEDDVELLEETFDVLDEFFYSVDSAPDGFEALCKYKENPDKYDLVITDINMPIMDGISLIKEIKQIKKQQHIVVISAYNESSRLIELIHNGITNFIMKPIIPDEFTYMIAKVSEEIYNQKRVLECYLELQDINTQLDERVKKLTREILFTQRLSVETIANMVENYDYDTGAHAKRIENYSIIITKLLLSSKDICEDLQSTIPFASLLHDIGKLMVPKHILNKPAKLNNEEFSIIKKHAKLGGDILLSANNTFRNHFNKDSYLKVASDIATYHHERWNGTGYPLGLKGEDIPISARVVAIADVYDALRSERVYKKAFSHSDAFEIIKSESSKSFDPKLVEIFVQEHKNFEEIFLGKAS